MVANLGETQRVLNDLWRTRVSRHLMIWLLPTPFPLPSISSTATHRKAEKERKLTDRREGGGSRGGAKSDDSEKAWSSTNQSVLSGKLIF